jgi:hypothetical protein
LAVVRRVGGLTMTTVEASRIPAKLGRTMKEMGRMKGETR